MTNPDKTAIAVVIDRSGSMASIKTDAEGGLRTFIEDQRNQPGEATIRLTQFDDVVEEVYASTPVADAPDYTLVPRSMTALRDAMGRTIVSLGEELAALDEDDRPGNVVFVVITDGYENASREYSAEAIKALVKQQEEQYGWNFVFLAANQDAVMVGGQYGFNANSSLTYDSNSDGTRAVFASASAYTSTTRSGQVAAFSDSDRRAASKS